MIICSCSQARKSCALKRQNAEAKFGKKWILLTLLTLFKILRAATRSVAACRWWYGEGESTWPCHYRLYLLGIQ